MIVDANVLLYAVDTASPHHERAAAWWTETLRGDARVALPWQTIGAFLRAATSPRVVARPLTAEQAWRHVEDWLACPVVWIPEIGPRTARLLGSLVRAHEVTGNLVADAQIAAAALEHGLTVVSADTDFARFPAVRWVNPVA